MSKKPEKKPKKKAEKQPELAVEKPVEEQDEPVVHETIMCKHMFSDAEKIDLGNQLANANNEMISLEGQKSQITKSFSGKIEEQRAKAKTLSNQISSGYEMRNKDCRVEFDCERRIKTYVRCDTGERVKTEDMTAWDFQKNLPEIMDPPKTGDEPANYKDGKPAEKKEEVKPGQPLNSIAGKVAEAMSGKKEELKAIDKDVPVEERAANSAKAAKKVKDDNVPY